MDAMVAKPTKTKITRIRATVPTQDVTALLGGCVLEFDLDGGAVYVGGARVEQFDAEIGLGRHQLGGRYEIIDAAGTSRGSWSGVLPRVLPTDPDRKGFLRLTVVDGVVMVGSAPWAPAREHLQELVDAIEGRA